MRPRSNSAIAARLTVTLSMRVRRPISIWLMAPDSAIAARSGAALADNPLGLDGFEFVEFTGPDPQQLADLFVAKGFTHLANHRSKNINRNAQGDINFIQNMNSRGQKADKHTQHGASANAMAFRVKDARVAFDE